MNKENIKKIIITNAYTWYNKGDAGILLATIDVMKKIYPNAEFNILSFTPEEDKKRYCKDKSIKNVESNIVNPHPYTHTKLGKLKAIFKLFRQAFSIKFNMKFNKKGLIIRNKSIKLLNESDLILVCGGGFLGGKKLDSLMHIFQIDIDTQFNKPVYILGTSIEPMHNKIVKHFTDKVIKKVDYVFAREEITENYLKDVLEKDKHCQIPDMAFALKDENYKFDFIDNYRKEYKIIVGFTVRKWNFPMSNDSEKASENYIKSISKTFEHLIDKYNALLIFVPQVIVNYANDTDIAKEIKNRVSKEKRKNIVIREDDWSPYEIKSLISNFDFFIGTRMHSNIFATSVNVPTLAIAYEKKTNGIMHDLDLDEYVIDINSIDEKQLENKVELVIKNREKIVNKLKIKIPQLREKIQDKIENVMEV